MKYYEVTVKFGHVGKINIIKVIFTSKPRMERKRLVRPDHVPELSMIIKMLFFQLQR